MTTLPRSLLSLFAWPLVFAALANVGCGAQFDEAEALSGPGGNDNRAGGAGSAGAGQPTAGGSAGGINIGGQGGASPSGGAAGGAGSGGSAQAGAGGGGTDKPLPPTAPCQACAAELCEGKTNHECACSLCLGSCDDYPDCGVGGGGKAGAGGSSAAGSGGSAGSAGSGPPGGQGGAGTNFENDCSNGLDDNEDGKADCGDSFCSTACANPCAEPMTLESGKTRQGLLAGHKEIFQPSCAPASVVGPSLVYRHVAATAGWLTVKVASAGDLVLSAHPAACLGDGGYSQCRNQVGPGGTEELTVEVKAGEEWFVLVTSAHKDEGPAFDITATFDAPVCGDGKLSQGEKCDDGNSTDGDGCSAGCSVDACDAAQTLADEVVNSAAKVPEPAKATGNTGTSPPSVLQPSCSKLGVKAREVVYSLRAANTGRLEVELTPDGPSDLVLSVWSTCALDGEQFCGDVAPAGGVERLSVPAAVGQPFYLVVEGYGADEGAFTIQARTLPVACGDGLLVPSVEQCDKTAEEKDCSADCTRLADEGDVPEPSGPVALTDEAGAQGRIFPAGDVDEFVVQVPDDKQGVQLSVVDPTLKSDCAGRHLDSQLELLDAAGATVLAFNDDGPTGSCSEIKAPLAPGKYLVRLRSSTRQAPAQVFSYRLVASFF